MTMPASPRESTIMTIGDVADYLKVTERTIYRLAGGKQISALKMGGRWRFSKVDIEQRIRGQSITINHSKSPKSRIQI